MDSRIKNFVYRPVRKPFSSEHEAASAYKKVFAAGDGAKVLDDLITSMEYFRPDLPSGVEQLAFNAGKKYVVNHILHALGAVYEEREELDTITTITDGDNYYE